MTKQAFLNKLWTLGKIKPEVESLSQTPLFGNAAPFDWQRLSDELKSRLQIETFSVQKISQTWKEAESLRDSLGHDVFSVAIDIASLGGPVYWMMAKQDIQKLTSSLIGKGQALSPILQEGFYRYLLLEALDAASGIEPLKTFTPILREEEFLANERSLCIDLELRFLETAALARLVIPSARLSSWRAYFANSKASISPTLARSLELSVSIQIGSVLLRPSQWQQVKKGDFILLDRGSYDPRHLLGSAYLVLGSTPIFQLSIEPKKIHVLNYAFIYEDATDMENNIPNEEEFEEEIPSLDSAEEAETVSLKETPVHITVELARLKMTLERLTELSPGNVLELPIDTDQIVALSVGGKKIGKAELVYLGENLGVRILELG